MKDKILLYWNKSSYLIRSVTVYTLFSVLAIISKLLDDKLGMLSSIVAIGFLVSMLSVIASIVYSLVMSIHRKIVFKEIFQAMFAVLLFLFLMGLIVPVKEVVVEQHKIPDTTIDNLKGLE
ncbi:MAG: hypothetical protein ACI9TV_003130 [Sulfurimonas sp.]|jgi:hypothetical protein|uniref:hypothetical protein n=1 Tax=Sulfurimonas sp. TaxID=2022749 RepID=UPI0039E3977F